MDELLKYVLHELAMELFYLELIVIIGCLIAVVCIKLYYKMIRNRNAVIQNFLTAMISDQIAGLKQIDAIPLRYRSFKNLLMVLEEFEKKITDKEWIEIRNKLQRRYLFKIAKRYLSNPSWIKRQLAARCFLLNPSTIEKKQLATLLKDKRFLIRVIAANIITKSPYRDLFFEVIRTMDRETRLTRYPYRDLIINSDSEKFEWILELLKTNPPSSICAICLDLLSTRTTTNIFPLLLPFIYGEDKECRFLAVKILKTMPSKESKDILFHCLNDLDWEIRAESLKSLDPALSKQWMPTIQELLHDSVWLVRLQAALLLKNLGNEGLKILSEMNPKKEPEAYEIARYVLANPSF